MDRESRFVNPLKSDALPSSMGCVAIASKYTRLSGSCVSVGEMVGGVISTWRNRDGKKTARIVRPFESPSEFWSALYQSVRANQSIWVFGMDMYHVLTSLGFWERLLSREIFITDQGGDVRLNIDASEQWSGYLCMADPPNIVICRPVGIHGTIRFIDVRNYGVSDWSALQESSDRRACSLENEIPLGRTFAEHARLRLSAIETWLDAYLTVIRELKLGSLQMTAGAQAITGWRRSYMAHAPHIHDCSDVLKLERAAYYGGRCEAKFIGTVRRDNSLLPSGIVDFRHMGDIVLDDDISHFDITSAYPAIVARNRLPLILVAYAEDPQDYIIDELSCRYGVIADVQLHTDEAAYPLRREDDDIVVYPLGSFRTTLADPEYRYAVLRGHVKHVYAMSAYTMADIGSDYMKAIWEFRLQCERQGNVLFADIAKRLGVAWVGKLMQRKRTWVRVNGFQSGIRFGQFWGRNPRTGKPCQWRTVGDISSYLEDDGEHNSSMPAISAFVTSFQRMRLWNAVHTAGHENVYYYDTDSLWTNRVGAERMKSLIGSGERELGAWRLVSRHRRVEFRGIKHYVTDGKLTCAGLAKDVEVYDAYSSVIQEPLALELFLWNKEQPVPAMLFRHVSNSTDYRHGIVSPDGTVKPHVIPATMGG